MKKILAVAAAVLMIVLFTSFVFAVDNGPVYEPLMEAESLNEFRDILLAENNRPRVMQLTYEEITALSCKVEHLFAGIADPSEDELYYKDEMLETLSILPNGPEALDGDPVTYANLSTIAAGTTVTANTTYVLDGNITLNGTIIVDNNATVTIENTSGTDRSITRGSGCGVMFRLNSGSLIIRGTNGKVTLNGGGLTVQTVMIATWGSLQCNNTTFTNATNTSVDSYWRGGAINCHSGSTELTGCTFSGMTATYGGAICVTGGSASASNCTFSNNTANTGGGAIYSTASINISNSSFTGNKATNSGAEGGAVRFAGAGRIISTTFNNNSAPTGTSHGGTIYAAPTSDTTIDGCVISNSTGGNGSAIYLGGTVGKTLTLSNSLIYGCVYGASNGGDGGTLRTNGSGRNHMVIDGCVIRDNTNIRGGSIYWNSQTATLTINDSQLLNNEATLDGGAIYFEGKSLIIKGSSTSITAAKSTLTTAPGSSDINGTRIQGNNATGTGSNGFGGAICFATYNDSTASDNTTSVGTNTLDLQSGVLLYNNTAEDGGAIAYRVAESKVYAAGHVFLINIASGVTIQSNTASVFGGAFYLNDSSTKGYIPRVNMSGGSIKSNTADRGGAAYLAKGEFNLSDGTIGGSGAGNTASAVNDKGETVGNGGAFYVTGGTLNLSGGTVSYNSCPSSGGAVCTYGSGVANLEGSTLSYNTAMYGGAINLDGGEVNISSGTIQNNTTPTVGGSGGGVRVAASDATFTMTGGTISQNISYKGGGIFVASGSCNISSGTISGNIGCSPNGTDKEEFGGGGLYLSGGTTTIGVKSCSHGSHPQILENRAGKDENDAPWSYHGRGAGIYVADSANVTMYCGNLDNNWACVYGKFSTSSYYQTGGTFNWCGGNLDVGNFVKSGTFKARNAANTADVTMYTVTYHLTDSIETTTVENTTLEDYENNSLNQFRTRQFVRTGSVTLPAGTKEGVNDSRYGPTQNTKAGGWTCMGWSEDINKARNLSEYRPVGDTYTVNKNVILYAAWYEGQKGNITYNYNNGTAGATNPSSYTITPGAASASSITISKPTRTGYTFTGWNVSGSGHNWTNPGNVTTVQTGGKYGNVTLTAQWTANTYTVSFNANGGSVGTTSKSVTYDSTYGTLPTPTRTGYTFAGWYTTASGGTQVTSSTKVTTASAHTLFAHWTANTNTAYKVQHWQQKLTGGSEHNSTNFALVSEDTQNLTGTTAASVTPAVKSYTGFTAPSTQTVTIAADGSTVVNYYYTRNSYTVTLNKGTGVASVTGAGSYKYGASVSINATMSAGYSWNGWTGTHNTSTQNHQFIMPAGNVTDTANAAVINYTITYDLGGGSVATVNPGSYNVTTASFALNNPTKPGFTFAGWTGTGLASATTNVTISSGSTGNRSYTATWTENKYIIAFNANGGEGTMSNLNPSYTQSLTLTANAFTRTGYTFTGWNTAANGTGTPYTNGATVSELTTTSNGTVTLHAQWRANTYTVVFNANGGSGTTADQSFTYDVAQALRLNGFSKTGHTFAGWNTAANGSGKSYTNGAEVINLSAADGGTVTLHAQWTPITYKIHFDANGGTGSMQDMSVLYGETATLTANGFSKPGYKFLGWSGSNGIDYDDKDSVINLADTNGAVITMTVKWELAAADFTINVAGLANGQSAVIKISGTRADGVAFNELSFAVVGNGNGNTVTTVLADLPVGEYTVSVNGLWTWRYSNTTASANSATTNSVTIAFTSNGNVKWLNAYGQTIN